MKQKWIQIAFLSIEGILYSLFLSLDIGGSNQYLLSNRLKYSSILLCFFYVLALMVTSILMQREEYEREDRLLVTLAIGATLISDTFLVLLNWQEAGVTTFICVQLLYWYRLSIGSNRTLFPQIVIWILILSVLFFANVSVDYLLLVTSLYFVLLISNVTYGLIHPINLLFTIGMVLFLGCDLNVGLYNLSSYLVLEPLVYERILSISEVAIWAFYLPSQVLICLSVKRK